MALCQTLSEKLSRSKNIISTGDPSSIHLVISSKNIIYSRNIEMDLIIYA